MTRSARPAGRRGRRRAVRLLVLVVLGVATLIAPMESGLLPGRLPGPLRGAVGESPAHAQTLPPVAGTPAACPSNPWPWNAEDRDGTPNPDGANCVQELPSCPESVPEPGRLMRLSFPPSGLASVLDQSTVQYMRAYSADALGYPDPVIPIPGMFRYPEFCEERHLDNDTTDPNYLIDPIYRSCSTMTGVVVESYTDPNSTPPNLMGCRILQPIECAVGLARVGSRTCRAVQRRLWTCTSPYIPHIDFNRCYQPPAGYTGTHPACGQGAPNFVPTVSSCDVYVGKDFIHPATTVVCGTEYPTDTPASLDGGTTDAVTGAPTVLMVQNYNTSGVSKEYWCAYDSRYLRADCHRTVNRPPDCTESMALCIRRATESGGCDLIAETIRCKAFEAAFAQSAVTFGAVTGQDCQPCTILPFEPAPADCQSRVYVGRRFNRSTCNQSTNWKTFDCWGRRLLQIRDEIDILDSACKHLDSRADLRSSPSCRERECADPPSGTLELQSTHFSDLAVVNSPVLASIVDVPFGGTDDEYRRYYRQTAPVSRGIFSDIKNYHPFYPATAGLGDIGVDAVWLTFGVNTANRAFNGMDDMVDTECRVLVEPLMGVAVDELWPDNQTDRDQITELFGSSSLNWWIALTTQEQSRRTSARGLKFFPGLTPYEQQAERRTRESSLTTSIECSVSQRQGACAWLPSRPGYYRLVGQGAWHLRSNPARTWGEESVGGTYYDKLNSELGKSSQATKFRKWLSHKLPWRFLHWPTTYAGFNLNTITLQEIGLQEVANVISAIPIPADASLLPSRNDWLYTEDAGSGLACFSRDFRVNCVGSSHDTANYTATAPVGIVVHAVRVSTVSSSP